jgi:hypothetical protein
MSLNGDISRTSTICEHGKRKVIGVYIISREPRRFLPHNLAECTPLKQLIPTYACLVILRRGGLDRKLVPSLCQVTFASELQRSRNLSPTTSFSVRSSPSSVTKNSIYFRPVLVNLWAWTKYEAVETLPGEGEYNFEEWWHIDSWNKEIPKTTDF